MGGSTMSGDTDLAVPLQFTSIEEHLDWLDRHPGPDAARAAVPAPIPEPAPTPAGELWRKVLGHGWWTAVLWGAGLLMGSGALSDNSFLTHLATGRLIRSSGAPHRDLYTFASRGTPLVVQSWLASWWYATLEAVGGAAAIRVFVAAVTGLLMTVLWRLSAPAQSLLGRVALVSVAALVGLMWWNERPQLIAFALLAGSALVLAERRSALWLTVIFGLWINVHGSFPLGLVYLVLALILRLAATRAGFTPEPGTSRVVALVGSVARAARREFRGVAQAVAASVTGLVAGALVSPYGLGLLTFPVKLTRRSSELILMSEWRPLSLSGSSARVFVAEVCLVGALLAMRREWVRFVAAAVFVALAFLAVRNVAVAAVALVPIAAPALAGLGDDDAGTRRSRRSSAAVIVAVAAVAVAWVAVTPDYDLSPYPVAAVDWMQSQGLAGNPRVRVLTHDYDGAYLEWRYGPAANTWLDDRAEVHSLQTTRDYVFLLSGLGDPVTILARHPHELVVWQRDSPIGRFLAVSNEYRTVYRDDTTIVACRLASALHCPDPAAP